MCGSQLSRGCPCPHWDGPGIRRQVRTGVTERQLERRPAGGGQWRRPLTMPLYLPPGQPAGQAPPMREARLRAR